MRLLRVHVIAADTCGGLLDGLDLWLRSPFGHYETFEPLCLIGPNGAGKSQFLQVLAEIFQAVFHAVVPEEERIEGNPSLQFEVEYLIRPHGTDSDVHVRIARLVEGRRRPALVIQTRVDGEWVSWDLTDHATLALLPPRVVGYTSGDNETLSLPFLLSRGGYADVVGRRALAQEADQAGVPDTRLLWIDYGTHLEVLVANLLLGANEQRMALLEDARLCDVHSFRCIIQLAHSAAPKAPARRRTASTRKGIQLTQELEEHLDRLRRCATCYAYEEKTETYIFDFLSVSERQQVQACLVQQNRIADLVTCSTDCESLSDLPKAIQAPVAELCGFAFELLTGLGVRDRHYRAIYNALLYHVCPFCGCEYFDAPGAPREDLDHYLPKSLYPFAAANLRNLVPMGMKCNERYKLAQDILRDAGGVRRRSFDPYAERQTTVILDNSIPFGGADGQTPDWQIDFDPDSIECTTWDNVFHVRERIKRDVLDSSFWQWLRDFSAWFKKRMGIADPGDAEVLDAMRTYAEDMALTGLTAREFLRAPVFRMLHRHCKAGNQRVLALMKDVVAMAVP